MYISLFCSGLAWSQALGTKVNDPLALGEAQQSTHVRSKTLEVFPEVCEGPRKEMLSSPSVPQRGLQTSNRKVDFTKKENKNKTTKME